MRSAKMQCQWRRSSASLHAPEGERPARLEVEEILDGRRNAVKRPDGRARHDRLLRGFRFTACVVETVKTNALRLGLRRSIRAMQASTISTGDRTRRRTLSAISPAPM